MSPNIVSVRQKKPLGLGHAIWTTRNVVGNEPFAVFLGDVVLNEEPCLKQMIALFDEVQQSIVAVQRVPRDQTHHYGIIEGAQVKERVHLVEHMVEKPSADETESDMAIIGRYILSPDIFEMLGNAAPGHGGGIQLTDALVTLAKKQKMYVYEFEGKRFDAGDKLGYLKAIIAYGLPPPHTCSGI